jgi:hypothetical protein
MDILKPSLAHACILAACADPCFFPGDHHKDRLRPQFKENGPMAPPARTTFGTWLASGSEIITIGKYRHGVTLVYIPSRDTFYFAGPSVMLSHECPENSIFIGQFVIDNDQAPRILVFDMLKFRGVACTDLPAQERYACLQKSASSLGPLCTLQWAGDCAALAAEMRVGKFTVPHAVRGVMALGSVPGRIAVYA